MDPYTKCVPGEGVRYLNHRLPLSQANDNVQKSRVGR